jgi:hypothetical protein
MSIHPLRHENVVGRIICRDFERKQLLMLREILWIARQTNSEMFLQNATREFCRQLDRTADAEKGASLILFKQASYRT